MYETHARTTSRPRATDPLDCGTHGFGCKGTHCLGYGQLRHVTSKLLPSRREGSPFFHPCITGTTAPLGTAQGPALHHAPQERVLQCQVTTLGPKELGQDQRFSPSTARHSVGQPHRVFMTAFRPSRSSTHPYYRQLDGLTCSQEMHMQGTGEQTRTSLVCPGLRHCRNSLTTVFNTLLLKIFICRHRRMFYVILWSRRIASITTSRRRLQSLAVLAGDSWVSSDAAPGGSAPPVLPYIRPDLCTVRSVRYIPRTSTKTAHACLALL